jgi:hypothetical protein
MSAKNVTPREVQKGYHSIKTWEMGFVNNQNVTLCLLFRALFRLWNPHWRGKSPKGLDIRMFPCEPAEDTEGIAEDKEKVDDFIGQGGHREELAQEHQGGHGCHHGCLGGDLLYPIQQGPVRSGNRCGKREKSEEYRQRSG